MNYDHVTIDKAMEILRERIDHHRERAEHYNQITAPMLMRAHENKVEALTELRELVNAEEFKLEIDARKAERSEQWENPAPDARDEVLNAYDVSDLGIIRSPGKFEGEMIYAPYYWDWALHGEGEMMQDSTGSNWTVFKVHPEDRVLFPEIPSNVHSVALMVTDQGFVYLVDNTAQYWSDLGTQEDRDERAREGMEGQTPPLEFPQP